ncbi:hypothetical protein KKG81_12960 [bacterium]|nr:hypothetical protein [bacterium]
MIKPEDRFMNCKHILNGVCSKKNHIILNRYASRNHCGNCEYFIKDKSKMLYEKKSSLNRY